MYGQVGDELAYGNQIGLELIDQKAELSGRIDQIERQLADV